MLPTPRCAPPIPTANGLRPYCPETTIHVSSWISTVYVVVPEDAEVRVAGTGIVGGFKQDRESPGYPAAHRINVSGVAVCGRVYVVHGFPAARERRLQSFSEQVDDLLAGFGRDD